ncbi:MAG: winged helix-turn-helix transcriptional regulator [Nanohaloarchaea archaeon]|nr:winged helix-turn-helix transcriptional regulator [Candidatus Nanohaloarchaea archaeon]
MSKNRFSVAFAVFLLLLSLSVPVSASQIRDHEIVIAIDDLGVAKTFVVIDYTSLTTDEVYYFVFAQIDSFEAHDDYGLLLCNTNRYSYGTQITCKPNVAETANYTVNLDFNMVGMQSISGDKFFFSYDYGVKIPTDSFSISFILPTGTAIIKKDLGIAPYLPEDAVIGSTDDGRHITVTWDISEPELGRDYSYRVFYERVVEIYSNRWFYPVVVFLSLLLVLSFVMFFRFKKARKIKTVLSVLHESERKVIEILMVNDGRCDQRQLVRETGFSKAKMSRMMFDLESRGLITKTRRGRTNIIELSDKK